jgi:sugar fermentation stimulation protein A
MTVFMPFPEPRIEARFVRRRNRFVAEFIDAGGETLLAHTANTGTLKSCLHPDGRCVLWDSGNPARKYPLSWKAIEVEQTWVGIDTAVPNSLVAEAIRAGCFPDLGEVGEIRREVKMGKSSRVDLVVDGPRGRTWIEVKNVTLVEGDFALFPDAVTTRGRKHLDELVDRVAEGDRAAMVYVVQRADGHVFAPADEIDPEYGTALRRACKAGVTIWPLGCTVTPEGVRVGGLLPFDLSRTISHKGSD